MVKKSLLLFFTAFVTLMVSAQIELDSSIKIDGIRYNLDSGTGQAKVTCSLNPSVHVQEYSGSITIPNTITYMGVDYSVTSIGDGAFSSCSSLTTITIPEGMTSIGLDAFSGCSSLTTITIPESVTSIGATAFQYCSSLTTVNIPDNSQLRAIGHWAFEGCRSLTSFNIPKSVTSIGERAFYGCLSLATVNIPEGSQLTRIESETFYQCSSLKAIIFPEESQLTSIGGSAFYDCICLTTIVLPINLKYIGSQAFAFCFELRDIYCYAGSVPETAPNAFYYLGLQLITLHVPDVSILDAYKRTVPWSDFGYIRPFIISGDCGDNLTWELTEECELTIEGTGEMYDFVSEADVPWYDYRQSIKTITISKGVESIGNHAFLDCENLTSITIPEGVMSIGDSAFDGCWGITSITIPEGVTSIGDSAFDGCIRLATVNIPENSQLTSIGDYAFQYCYRLTSITIPEGVTSIGDYAFCKCSSLTSTTLPESVTSIGNNAFCNCTGELFVNCNIPSASSSDHGAFFNSKFTKATIGDKLTSIGDYAFYKCSSLTSITISDNSHLTNIGGYAFQYCENLTSITLPEGVMSIGDGAFLECRRLTAVNILENSQLTSIGDGAFENCYRLTSITLPESVTSIGNNAFCNCTGELFVNCNIPSASSSDHGVFFNSKFTKATIGDKVTSIGDYAFQYCTSLTSITIPESVTSIGHFAFDGCSSLATINIPENSQLTSIGNYAFVNCSSLTTFVLPKKMKNIGSRAFAYCSGLRDIYSYAESAPLTNIDAFDTLWLQLITLHVPDVCVLDAYKKAVPWSSFVNIQPIIIASGACGDNLTWELNEEYELTIEGTGEMYYFVSEADVPWHGYRQSIKTITISKGVKSIGYSAFSGCSSLTDITLPTGLKSIGAYAFKGCSSLTAITIPESMTSIGDCAFLECSSLTAVHISDIVAWCNIKFNVPESNPLFYAHNLYQNGELVTEVTLPEGVTSIGKCTFYNCSSLTSITLPEDVTSIGYCAFRGCSNLISITLPEGLMSIGEDAFWCCSSLTTFTIPSSMTSIGDYAFCECSGLTAITCKATTPPTIDESAFYGVSKSIFVYVPVASVMSYKEAEGWETFVNIRILVGESYTLAMSAAGYATMYLSYAVEIPENMEVYYASKVQDNYLKMTQVTGVIPANTGVIVRAAEGDYTFTEVEGEDAAIEGNLLVGTTTDTYITVESGYKYYVLAMVDGVVGMYRAKIKDNGTFLNNANKAYLPINLRKLGVYNEETNTDEEGGQSSNRFRFDFGDTTDIENTTDKRSSLAGGKSNGQQIKVVYDLYGRCVTDAVDLKGIYIVNGKKTVIK